MSGAMDIFGGKKSDGVSMQSHAAMKEAGVGPYEVPPPPPPPPESNFKGQVGSTILENEKKLKEMLIKQGNSPEQAERRIQEHKKQKGYR